MTRFILLALLSIQAAHAEVWLTTIPYVKHAADTRIDGRAWNSRPNGLGLSYAGGDFEADVSEFRNSYGRQSWALGGSWRALHSTYVDAGGFSAIASGYAKPVIGGLYVQAQYGDAAIRALLLPKAGRDTSAAVALQLRFRL